MRPTEAPRTLRSRGLLRVWDRGVRSPLLSPAGIATLLVLLAQLPLHAGWLVDPTGRTLANPFHGTHAWALDVVGDALWAGDWPDPTDRAGFPGVHRARFVGWALLVSGVLLAPLTGAIAAVNLGAWVGPALGAAAMVGLARKLEPGATRTGLVLGGVTYGLAPVGLGAALSGQVENAQTWVLPVLLLALAQGCERWRRAPAVAGVWLLGALTSPYLAMAAAAAAVWLPFRLGWRRMLPVGVAAGLGLGLAGTWLDAASYDPGLDLFKPAYATSGWPDPWGDPPSVADVKTLLTGGAPLQARAMVIHQSYLGLVAGTAAVLLGRSRVPWVPLVLCGTILAMGPELGFSGAPVTLGGRHLALPGIVLRWLDLPVAHGGQYYRFMALTWLGWAGMLATARPRRLVTAGAGVAVVLDALRTVASPGLPWPTTDLPASAWQAWADDPVAGGVVHLPAFSPALTPNRPIRLAGSTVHGRPIADMPRAEFVLSDHPDLQLLDRCTRRGEGCRPPSLSRLGAAGFRFAVLDLAEGAERTKLAPRLAEAWGAPSGEADGLAWWTCPPPEEP